MPGGSLIAPVFGLIIAILAFSFFLNAILGRDRDIAPQALAPERDAYDREKSVAADWSQEELFEIGQELARALSLEIEPISEASRIDWEFFAQDPRPIVGGRYVFRAVRVESRELIPGTEIEAFHASFKVEDIKKGILITNGFFSEDAVYQAEDRPVEILNRLAISEWAESSGFSIPTQKISPKHQGSTDEQSEV